MKKDSKVAALIAERIEATGQLQKDVAAKVGFPKPNIITMLKQGKTRLPLDKIGPMARALETDPIQLLQLCMEEYHPTTWRAIAPFMESAFTEEEVRLLNALRASVGGPFLAAVHGESRTYFEKFIQSLRSPSSIH